MEFHVSRKSRDLYQFDQALYSITGNVIFPNFHAVRMFTQKMNQKRNLTLYPEQSVRAGQINAMGMIDEILHYVIGLYRQQVDTDIFKAALRSVEIQLTREKIDQTLHIFVEDFPPTVVYQGKVSIEDYMAGETEGISNRQVALEELLMLWLANSNPAFSPFAELFDDTHLTQTSAYPQVINSLQAFFKNQPFFGPDHQNLIDMLRSPAVAVPYSLQGQLEYIRERWAALLGNYLYRLLGSLDLIREEERTIFGGPGPARVPRYGLSTEGEAERFSPDREWMPTLVLIAKNSYVWLDQLSRKYQREIRHLDQVPDEELDQLRNWGFSGLWLIGLWERSQASERIKRLMGNPEAVASAYSLTRYQIALDLGGDSAYNQLRERAWQRGLRLASDMVPNHMGIDSDWVIHHPDWFISQDYSPFPSYSFNGPDLSNDPRVGIQIEDHYYTKTDAAVVFKRTDRWTGAEKYIYHGNDGTSFPWNDTAQLNYLNPEVREAVIQTILHVARQFPIIRFDAAMTLTKKHYQRLWYPEPGTGGDIPSRADHSMTKEQFNRLMPEEFWREVVDRVAKEVPDTLLLAEAFWLMEGYFVRTLGMHRVYNSAFMNMVRNEDNANYRQLIKNTLEFDPEILKRYVNFMNNPDEKTAFEQFGKGDKYFGICTLMVTMPGLPMFGHGQVEGFSEKYGMEFRRAYWDEVPDPYLVQRHEREIFPLLHKRYLFSGVENFLLYDFFTPDGAVNEDVYAFSNSSGNERGLVIYHNCYGSTRGWLRTSAAFIAKTSSGGRHLVQKTLAQGLNLHPDGQYFTIFRDEITGLQYIRSSAQLNEQGLFVELNAYQAHVFIDFHEVLDNQWNHYAQLNSYLEGHGVPDIQDALRELFLQPIRDPFRTLVNPSVFQKLMDSRLSESQSTLDTSIINETQALYERFLGGIRQIEGGNTDLDSLIQEYKNELILVLDLLIFSKKYPLPNSKRYAQAIEYLQSNLMDTPTTWGTLFGYLVVHKIGEVSGSTNPAAQARTWIDEWRFGKVIETTAQALGLDESGARQVVQTIKILTSQQDWFVGKRKTAYNQLETWLQDEEVQHYLGINRYQGILWYNQESFEQFVWWMYVLAVLGSFSKTQPSAGILVEVLIRAYDLIQQILYAEVNSEFQVIKLLDNLAGDTSNHQDSLRES